MPISILVADDDGPMRRLISTWLERDGYVAVQAEDGAQALDLLSAGKADLAIVDVMMPKKTGFAVARTIKFLSDRPFTPIILVTGLESTEDRIQGIEAGADDFLTKPVRRDELLARVRALLRMKRLTDDLESAEAVICTLAESVEAKDPYTRGHCQRLAELCHAIGARLNLPPEVLLALRRGGIVHDIGKVGIPDNILLKPGRLSAEERAIIQTHAVIGERICAPLNSFKLVLPIIRHHHEKRDGSGYPDGLKGNEIPLTARILQITDVYDALTTDRPYRKALPIEQAFRQIEHEVSLGWWDPEMFELLKAVVIASSKRAQPALDRRRAVRQGDAAGQLGIPGSELPVPESHIPIAAAAALSCSGEDSGPRDGQVPVFTRCQNVS